MTEYIADRLIAPSDVETVISWEKLTTTSQNTLRRAIERSDIWRVKDLKGFTYELLTKIEIQDLQDARFIGPVRVGELIDELIQIFQKYESRNNHNRISSTASKVVTVSSMTILAKLTVETKLETYLQRIGSYALLNSKQRHSLLTDLSPSKNPFKRIAYGRRDHESALGQLVDANLRLSFAVAKRVYVEKDIRARTIAGNLGLLAGITTFSDQPHLDFESHILESIREFIQELIGVLDLSYKDIVELLLDANEIENQETEVDEDGDDASDEDRNSLESCSNFVDLYQQLDIELLKLPKVDARAIQMLKHRHQAFGGPGRTLDEIGQEWGVTRERVRQIVDPLMRAKIHQQNIVPILEQAVDLFLNCNDEDEFEAVVQKNAIFAGKGMTWHRLWALCRILSAESLADKLYEKNLEWEQNFGADSTIRNQIRGDRSKFGLYDLKVVSKKYEIGEAQAFKVIAQAYPRSIKCGSLVLARTKNIDTMFENSIVKQLKVSSPLKVQELLKGLQRTGKQRDVSLIGSVTDLTSLIELLAGTPPNYQKASSGSTKKVEFQALETWLIEVFSESYLGILHTNDIVNLALREKRINISSLTVYLLNSPIMRSHGRSLYSLVGTEVSDEQLDTYIQIIRGTSEASEVSYEMQGASKGILYVKPNLNVITSGIVFPPPGCKKIFESYKFASSCSCGELETIQSVKFSPSGFWTGFTAMIRHGFSQHGMAKESTFKFEFDFEKSWVRLLGE